MTEYQPYGVRHFLRELDPEGASELRRRPVLLKDGSMLAKGKFAGLAAFRPSDLSVYRTLVLRRSPVESRPPAAYRLAWSGRFYHVWQRDGSAISTTPLSCPGRTTTHPVPAAGAISVVVGSTGRYDLWVGGSFRGKVSVLVDGRRVTSATHQLSYEGQYVPLAQVALTAGRHAVELRQAKPALRPGTGGPPWPMGPLALSPVDRCGTGV